MFEKLVLQIAAASPIAGREKRALSLSFDTSKIRHRQESK